MSVDAAKKGKTLVSVEDQLQINKFARLHKQFLEAKVVFNFILIGKEFQVHIYIHPKFRNNG